MIAHVRPFAEVGFCYFTCSAGNDQSLVRWNGKRAVVGRRESIQFLSPLKMLVVVEEVIPALAPCTVIYGSILTRFRALDLADRAVQRFGREFRISEFFVRWDWRRG